MIDQSENKAIPGPRLQRRYLSPSAPNAERMVCGSCHAVEPACGGGIVHKADCKWAKRQRELARAREVETK